MDLDSSFKRIRATFQVAHGKGDADVILRYTGTSHGVTKPWHLTIESYTVQAETFESAIREMMGKIKKDLEKKIESAQDQITRYQSSLKQLSD